MISDGLEHCMTIRIEQIADDVRHVELDYISEFPPDEAVRLLAQVIGSLRYHHWKLTREFIDPDGRPSDANQIDEIPF
jgi:hypothetical protein